MSQNNSQATQPESSGPPMALIIFFVILAAGVIGFFMFNQPAVKLPAAATASGGSGAPCVPDGYDSSGQAINAGGYLIDAKCNLLTDAKGEPILGAGVAG